MPKSVSFSASPSPLRTLKKYPNRRLYDTETSSYITLSDVQDMVLQGLHFVVQDAKTGADLTRSVLLQIILEQEAGGMPMFSKQALAQMIRFYGHAMQGAMGAYLEKNLQIFSDLQNRLGTDPVAGGAEAWSKLFANPALAVPDLLAPYLEKSRQLLMQMAQMAQMQEQIAKQTGMMPLPKMSDGKPSGRKK
jgi:polyhydroxyalkanoate synthesis repressor PhaR